MLREPAGGKIIRLAQDDIEVMRPAKVSAMPPGLVAQLRSRDEFLDLIRFLIEISDHGPNRLAELKNFASKETAGSN